MSTSWWVSLKGHDGVPRTYRRDYPGKGVGLIFDVTGGKFRWIAYIEYAEDSEVTPMESGYTNSLKRAKDMLDDYFDLVDEYE